MSKNVEIGKLPDICRKKLGEHFPTKTTKYQKIAWLVNLNILKFLVVYMNIKVVEKVLAFSDIESSRVEFAHKMFENYDGQRRFIFEN